MTTRRDVTRRADPLAVSGTAEGSLERKGPPETHANAAPTPRARLNAARLVVEDAYPIRARERPRINQYAAANSMLRLFRLLVMPR